MKYAIIDFETTGLVSPSLDYNLQPGITQIGALILDSEFNERAVFNALVDPDMPLDRWSTDAIRVTGIGPEQVKDARTFAGVFYEFAQFVRGCEIWAGWNTKFDRDVLWHQLNRYGFERSFPWPTYEEDTMKLVGKKLGCVPGKRHDRWKLTDAYAKVFGQEFDDAHDAVADVRATGALLTWGQQ